MTWDHILNGFIADLPTLIAAVLAVIVTVLDRKHTMSNGQKIDNVHAAVNGRLEGALQEIEELKNTIAQIRGKGNNAT